MVQTKLIIICGPTCVGKTHVGIELAKKLNGEIISADSQQVYKELDIGTAKPTVKELKGVQHFLINVIPPSEQFDASKFVKMADKAIGQITSRGKLPIVVGGTGLYIKVLCYGLTEAPGRDEEYRTELNKLKAEHGTSYLYQMLTKVDPDTAKGLSENDTTRVIRALEVIHLTGCSIRDFYKEHGFNKRRYKTLKIGLNIDRNALYKRIDKRVDEMIEGGLEDEVTRLVEKYGTNCPALKAVGYKELVSVIARSEATKQSPINNVTIDLIKRNTRHYAKRQLTWFKADKEIEWYKPTEIDKILSRVTTFINK